jgi:hypothetical protein
MCRSIQPFLSSGSTTVVDPSPDCLFRTLVLSCWQTKCARRTEVQSDRVT